ncbi:MAG: type II secretion system F family protein [Candidatus Aenigmarchaeota archaeon]|nr:type II secretion system F family protein [Candidatus Aenigmarchaeota archaeon]
MKRFRYWHQLVFVFLGAATIALNFLFVADSLPFLFPVINVTGSLIATVPIVLILYTRYKTNMEIEQQFIVFIRDLSDSIDAGMTLPLALNQCSKNEYMALTPYVNDMAAQVDWGIPFKRALETFAKKIDSVTVKRSITTIIETYKVGGKVADTLNAINRSLITVEKIKKERSSSVHSQVVTSYMIFFVFIFILIILQSFLIPSLTQRSVSSVSLSVTGAPETLPTSQDYSDIFTIFIVMQGFFAGLATGKMAEGSIVSGLKHSVILIVTGYLVFSMASQFQFGF